MKEQKIDKKRDYLTDKEIHEKAEWLSDRLIENVKKQFSRIRSQVT